MIPAHEAPQGDGNVSAIQPFGLFGISGPKTQEKK
jgi:hypothetical protein